MTSHKCESNELKNFISSLRSGNLLKLIESNQMQCQEKFNTMSTKLKQSEEEITRQLLILQQNSHLIEKFQNQLQEVSNQNSELLEQQQVLKQENEDLKNSLQSSEDKFYQLDMAYDQQVSVLSERIHALVAQNAEMESIREKGSHEFDQTQTELNEKLAKFEQLCTDLNEQITNLTGQHEDVKKGLKSETDKVKEINEDLRLKIINYEERIKDLHNNLIVALDENKKIPELKNEIENLNNIRDMEQNQYRNEKSKLIAATDNLKSIAEDLKKKLSSKEKETQDIYLKFKQLAKIGTSTPQQPLSIQSSKYPSRKRVSSDDPKPLEDSSDSDGSSVSFYKMRKNRQISTETDDENLFNNFQNPNNVGKDRKPNISSNQYRSSLGPARVTQKRSNPLQQEHIEIPESPIVSSSAFDQKL